MKKGMMLVMAFLCSISLAVYAGSNSTNNSAADYRMAQNTIENWFATMKNDPAQAGKFLASEFMSIHTDRVVRNKEQEIELIKNLQMKEYHLSGFKFSHSGNVIIVMYNDQASEKIDNKEVDTAPAGRMAVLQKQGNKWLILAYANLDQIG